MQQAIEINQRDEYECEHLLFERVLTESLGFGEVEVFYECVNCGKEVSEVQIEEEREEEED